METKLDPHYFSLILAGMLTDKYGTKIFPSQGEYRENIKDIIWKDKKNEVEINFTDRPEKFLIKVEVIK